MILLYLVLWNMVVLWGPQTSFQHCIQVNKLSIQEKMSVSDSVKADDILKVVFQYFNDALREERKHFNDYQINFYRPQLTPYE